MSQGMMGALMVTLEGGICKMGVGMHSTAHYTPRGSTYLVGNKAVRILRSLVLALED